MPQDRWTAVDRYIMDLFFAPDPTLDAALEAAAAAGLPPIQVAPNQGRLLQILARVQVGCTILDIRTLGGYSTIWLALALPVCGRLITLEVESKHAAVAGAHLAQLRLACF